MIIQNYEDLATSEKKRECLDILEAGLRAADPENIIPKFVTAKEIKINDEVLKIEDFSNIYTVAFGKAGDSMTRALNAIIPIKSGIIVIPKGSKSKIKGKKFQIFNSGHPKPDQTSVKAAKEVTKFLQNRRDGELTIFLVSGGGSALLAIPDDITLEDKIYVTELLLKSGASIQEFNCIRKHLSKIKGGKLVENIKCHGIALVMSDVEGDDLSTIASGTTYKDDTTFLDALNIINKYKLKNKIPLEIMQRFENGFKGEIPETPKKIKIKNYIIANNKDCLKAMESKAKDFGYATKTIQVFGNIKDATQTIMKNIPEEKGCLIFGGETTVEVIGKGMGGRNQELVLRILKNSQNLKKIVIAAIGTDGIDGNSLFAGAITENIKIEESIIKEFLKNSDSGRFFQKQKCNIKTDFTHTNLMDIGIILK
ncbi:hydroxypyruvate reductase [Candidatus Nitrosarchaeum limnium SFB1]|jgi:glycerate 2-kinase|uniref:Hydroxypyruvate reductase n=1 Tax=Candidatus Nitrosarchaeum limnium SFB1 TaxID=886738 RepID=F3KK00_9ARCH|nr:hydroxypyruvate reductase [Candidatus Nitrosarchaeum limnium SFB1]